MLVEEGIYCGISSYIAIHVADKNSFALTKYHFIKFNTTISGVDPEFQVRGGGAYWDCPCI
jgi:hypothetical protein